MGFKVLQLQAHTCSASSSSAASSGPGASSSPTKGAPSYSAASSSCSVCRENICGIMYCLMGTRAIIITGNMTPTICNSSHTYQPATVRSHKVSEITFACKVQAQVQSYAWHSWSLVSSWCKHVRASMMSAAPFVVTTLQREQNMQTKMFKQQCHVCCAHDQQDVCPHHAILQPKSQNKEEGYHMTTVEPYMLDG